nr:hypothetical protein GCM10025699_77430 [Microbacterium flavescens]
MPLTAAPIRSSPDASWCGRGEVERERPAHRVADDDGPFDLERVEQLDQVAQVRERRLGRGGGRLAEAPPVVRDEVEVRRGQRVGHPGPAAPIRDAGVQQDHGRPAAGAALGDQGRSVGQGDLAPLRAHGGTLRPGRPDRDRLDRHRLDRDRFDRDRLDLRRCGQRAVRSGVPFSR